ncbi:MAG: MFS transporter [Acidimicrobiales bacterium]|nr:MFS transporter [Acidimicrobiales bacterium]MBO0886368.1 MFS transporter [Acidimicrobiales bacterium]MBO0893004.1 MFS transporter [Acidimicrobiales bacterium]
MSTTLETFDAPGATTGVATESPPDPRRFKALAIIAIAQLMIVLDATVVIIALPSAQRALHISVANRQWMLTAYTLAFGGLLLLGGRVADYLGRKRMFMLGLLGFAAASALGGLAQNEWMLFGSRALQGAMAAVMAPAALSLLTVTFTEPTERARAFGVYAAIAGGGSAIGLVLGGLLTEYASWRWTLLVNAPIAVIAAMAASRTINESKAIGHTRYDVPGAVTITAGLMALVYGFTRAQTDSWSAPITIGLLAAGAALVATFVAIETRTSHPLLPLRVVLHRDRGGSYLAMLLAAVAMFGAFLFLTYYLQQTLGYSALKAGLAFLPLSAGVVVSAGGVASRLLPRIGPRPLMLAGMALGAGGFLWLTQIGTHTGFWTHVLAPELVIGFGLGMVFAPVANTALIGVSDQDAGVASALLNTSQQVGSSLGIALLNTIAASATASYLSSHAHTATAAASGLVHGYTTGFMVSAGFLALAFLVTLVLIRGGRPGVNPATEPEAMPESLPEMELASSM